MKGKKKSEKVPAGLRRGRERFERWRGTRQNRRIPATLWNLAVSLAKEFGVYRTSRSLRLSYDDLKKRVGATPANGKASGGGSGASRFVPMVASGMVGSEGTAEYKGVDGSWLRVEWKGTSPDLAQLSESFFFGGRS